MGVQDGWVFTREDVERTANHGMQVTLMALVTEGKLELEEASEWAKTHAVILRKPYFWERLKDCFKKKKNDFSWDYMVAKVVSLTTEDKNEQKKNPQKPEENEKTDTQEDKKD